MSVLVRNSAGGGYDFNAQINVTYPPEAVVTCSLGDRTYTDPSHTGSHKFRVHKAGTWIVKAVSGSKESTREVVIETNGQVVNIELTFSQIFGITRDITNSSPEWARTDKAVGMTATASVGTVAGQSDFDNYMPWSGITRETLSTGDVMVKIPKFWYQRYITGNIETIKIANGPTEGFAVHPAFNHAGVESDYIYVGAYKTSSNELSKSGMSPWASQTRATMRTKAQSKGSGWGIIDISTVSAIQMLYLVEFANNNSQSVIGQGYTNFNNNCAIITGKCDSVPNLTGRPSGKDDATDVVYRGIEGFWGNVNEWVDGINCSGNRYYVCNNPSQYADDTASNYELLSFTAPSSGYIGQMGVDNNNSGIIMPSVVSGSSLTHYCDSHYSGSSSSWYVYRRGGGWSTELRAGLFFSECDDSSSYTSAYIGSRLLYIPQ